ncbi:hypothetical protein Emag_005392 [Eimeria magna]
MGLVRGPETRKFFVPDFRRDASYSKLTEEDRMAFRAAVADPESQMLWMPVPAEGEKGQSLSSAPEEAETLSTLATYTTDWLGIYTPEAVEGSAAAVLLPRSTEEVQRILKHCSERRLAVCIQAGNTGLVGGSVPVYDEVVLSLRRMNKILSFDAETGVLVVEAGCLISDVEAFLASFSRNYPRTKRYELNGAEASGVHTLASSSPGKEEEDMQYPTYMYPLDLGSKGSCCVGGTVASAAGGNRYLRYGGAHKHVLGLEAVTGEGRILQHLNTSQKNNESLHLHQLLIGSEGALGVITKLAIQCVPAPRSTTVTLFALQGPFERVRRLCVRAKESLSDILSALEFFDETCMRLTTCATGLPHPFSPPSSSNSSSSGSGSSATNAEAGQPSMEGDDAHLVKKEGGRFYLLLETHGQCPDTDSARVEEFAAQLQEQQTIDDAVIAMTETQKADTWRLREDIAVASASACLKVLKFDVSINVAHMYEPVELLNALLSAGEKLENRDFTSLVKRAEALSLQGAVQQQGEKQQRRPLPAVAIGYGHVGDGNIHINVLIHHNATAEEVQEIQLLCDKLVYGFVRSQKGSISAEHGVGVLKAAAVPSLKGPDFMHLVTGVKRCFDPNHILNPYKGWRDSGSHTAF